MDNIKVTVSSGSFYACTEVQAINQDSTYKQVPFILSAAFSELLNAKGELKVAEGKGVKTLLVFIKYPDNKITTVKIN